MTFGQSADLSIVKSHNGTGRIGQNTAFRLVVSNDGPSTATGITVVDTLPRGLDFVDAAGSDPLWTCVAAETHLGQAQVGRTLDYLITVNNSGPTENPGTFTIVDKLPTSLRYLHSAGDDVQCVAVEQTVTCTFEGTLLVGESRTVTLTVDVLEAAFPQVVNTVTAHSSNTDTAQTPITDVDTATVLAAPMILGLVRTGVDAAALFVALTAALMLLLVGIGLLWRARRRGQLPKAH